MNATDDLDGALRAWLLDYPAPYRQESVERIVAATAGRAQRPRWTFLERWLPMSVATLGLGIPRVPWRTVAVLVALAALLPLVLVLPAGSPAAVPSYGPAGNGLIAFSLDGDIHVVDPETGDGGVLVGGAAVDREPRWSLDGSRLAFLRATPGGERVVVVDPLGREISVSLGAPLQTVDPDSLAWSPDGRTFGASTASGIRLVDAATGDVTRVDVPHGGMEFLWRPPDGRELLFLRNQGGRDALAVASPAGGQVTTLVVAATAAERLRPGGWTPDGRGLLYDRGGDWSELRTHVLDLATGTETVLPVAFGHVSNDGRWVVGLVPGELSTLCVVGVGGGPCAPIGTIDDAPVGTHASSFGWSPDDAWVLVMPADGSRVVRIGTEGTGPADREWAADGPASWQRVAP